MLKYQFGRGYLVRMWFEIQIDITNWFIGSKNIGFNNRHAQENYNYFFQKFKCSIINMGGGRGYLIRMWSERQINIINRFIGSKYIDFSTLHDQKNCWYSSGNTVVNYRYGRGYRIWVWFESQMDITNQIVGSKNIGFDTLLAFLVWIQIYPCKIWDTHDRLYL